MQAIYGVTNAPARQMLIRWVIAFSRTLLVHCRCCEACCCLAAWLVAPTSARLHASA